MPTDDELGVDLDFLRASARAFLAERGEKDSVEELARMDWTGLLVDEAHGGVGWRPVEAAVVAEEIGRAGDRSAWLGSVVAAAALATAPDAVRRRLLPGVLDGSVTAAVALRTAGAGAVRVARVDRSEILMLLADEGIELIDDLDALPRYDDADLLDVHRPVHRVDVSAASKRDIGTAGRSAALRGVARLLVSADSIGALAATFDRLVSYLNDRTAFGARIASFQAVQHRLVDLLVLQVKSRAIVMKAMRAVAVNDPRAAVLTAAAHAFVTANTTAAVDECMQLSGGIGFTWEYPLHHELRRVFGNAQLFGTARSSHRELGEVAGW
ncbi:acyl-CoA dehydrogenase family protein [Mycolicibacter hiberniae]|uniref:Acyl-CoA dehydrogenase n=1 Tax=Mycolicibacter hiberniae TaxID=29314 RepID=A0A7I7X9V9_9MYCO|nr:acyl-CoA dehydrogenase family protein [Mycolicibacter hiberniae]MCV7087114.1 acyl-CoA/acyl-ACP dehydrogenase [Mycolicibacter hiberniae]ORV67880.1 acyl-CoA dehydrogenase [Mycolicibacter hiberniae]BBZ25673.1 acyl-CoA dehydrogenase [Mycolicibacter hiberniae]